MKNYLPYVLLFLLLGQPLLAQENEPTKISVTGEGVVKVIPDQAHLFFGINTEGEDPLVVKQENDELSSKLLEILKKNGVEDKDIKTRRLSLRKLYNNRPEIKDKYTATQTFSLLIRNLDDYPEISALLLTSGVNQVDRVEFSSTRYEELKDEARKKAVKDALDKIEVYSNALGMTPSKLIEIREAGSNGPAPVYRMEMAKTMADSGANVAPGELVISQEIQIMYTLK